MSVSIYRIYSDKGELQYYGSTTRTLKIRFSGHKSDYKYNARIYCTSIKLFQEYGVENCYIELLEEVTEELRKEREAYYIKTFECVNKMIPGRTKAEYQAEYREKYAEYQKEYKKAYYKQNKKKQAEHHKAYYDQNKEKITEYSKAYKQQHKEKIAEYQKRYREKQKKSSNNIDNAEEAEEKKRDTEEI